MSGTFQEHVEAEFGPRRQFLARPPGPNLPAAVAGIACRFHYPFQVRVSENDLSRMRTASSTSALAMLSMGDRRMTLP